MSTPAPMTYAIRVHGHLDDHWSNWLGDRTISRDGDGTTTLTGRVEDQTQLHGLPACVRDLGATLLEVHAVQQPGR